MKTCLCGHVFAENEDVCPVCGRSAKDAKEEGAYAAPISSVAEPIKDEPEMPAVAPISAVFEEPKSTEGKPKKQVVRPEMPKPGPKVEVKPVANTATEKFNPMKNPPPQDSNFSVLGTVGTTIRVFVLLIPGIGFIYSLILTLGVNKKENNKKLGVGFLTAILLHIVVIAAIMLVFALVYEVKFNDFIEVVIHTFNTFVKAIKTL